MPDLADLMAKLIIAIDQLRAAENAISEILNEVQLLVVTQAEADKITIDDPEG